MKTAFAKIIRAAILEAVRESQSPWLSYEAAAAYVGYSVRTVQRWVDDGQLRKYFPPGATHPRFRRSDLDALMVPEEPKIKLKSNAC